MQRTAGHGDGAPQPSAQDALAAFERLVAREDSATSALEQWCRMRRIGICAISATPVGDGATEAPGWVRTLLEVDESVAVTSRHVTLACGGIVLSDARNWYRPHLLPQTMRDTLAGGSLPFGKVIAPLGFARERLESTRGPAHGCPPGTVLTNRALIRLPSGVPLACVIEGYQPAILLGG